MITDIAELFEDYKSTMQRLESVLMNLARPGLVTEVIEDKGRVRVVLPDADNQVTYELPVLGAGTYKNCFYSMPEINSQVLCVFIPYQGDIGCVVGSMYSDVDLPPVTDRNKHHIAFKDGAVIEYDTKLSILFYKGKNGTKITHNSLENTFDLDSVDDVNIKCKKLTLQADDIKLEAKNEYNLGADYINTKSKIKTVLRSDRKHYTVAPDIKHDE